MMSQRGYAWFNNPEHMNFETWLMNSYHITLGVFYDLARELQDQRRKEYKTYRSQ